MSDLVPRKTMVKQGGYAIGGVAGGVALMVLSGIGGLPALIVGGVIALVGLAISGSKDDRTAGSIAVVAGVVTAAAAIPFIGGIAHALLTISGIGLLIVGGLNLWKFIKNYRKRM